MRKKNSTKQKYWKHWIEKSLVFFTLVENIRLNLWFIFFCVSFFLSERCVSPQNPRHQTWKCRGNPSLTRGPSTLLALGIEAEIRCHVRGPDMGKETGYVKRDRKKQLCTNNYIFQSSSSSTPHRCTRPWSTQSLPPWQLYPRQPE